MFSTVGGISAHNAIPFYEFKCFFVYLQSYATNYEVCFTKY